MQAIDVHRECTNCVVTFWVMSQFLHFLGASRGCADFRDPTAVFRFTQIVSGVPLWELGKSLISPSIDIGGVQQSRRMDLESGEG